MVLSSPAFPRGPILTLVLTASLGLGTMSALAADYVPPKLVAYDDLVAATKEVMGRHAAALSQKFGYMSR